MFSQQALRFGLPFWPKSEAKWEGPNKLGAEAAGFLGVQARNTSSGVTYHSGSTEGLAKVPSVEPLSTATMATMELETVATMETTQILETKHMEVTELAATMENHEHP